MAKKTETFTPFDPAEYLEGMDDIGSTLRDDELISAFEATRPSYKPVTQ